jgi:hypothetical protein
MNEKNSEKKFFLYFVKVLSTFCSTVIYFMVQLNKELTQRSIIS